jgi:hypothetical protein
MKSKTPKEPQKVRNTRTELAGDVRTRVWRFFVDAIELYLQTSASSLTRMCLKSSSFFVLLHICRIILDIQISLHPSYQSAQKKQKGLHYNL